MKFYSLIFIKCKRIFMISFNDNKIKQERCLLDTNEIFFDTIKNITDMEKPSVKNPAQT